MTVCWPLLAPFLLGVLVVVALWALCLFVCSSDELSSLSAVRQAVYRVDMDNSIDVFVLDLDVLEPTKDDSQMKQLSAVQEHAVESDEVTMSGGIWQARP